MDLLKKPDLEARIARARYRLAKQICFRLWAEKARKRWKNRAFAGLGKNGAGSRSRTGTPSLAVDFESTTSTNSIIPAHYIFDENPRKQSLEIGGPFRRSIGNFENTGCEKT